MSGYSLGGLTPLAFAQEFTPPQGVGLAITLALPALLASLQAARKSQGGFKALRSRLGAEGSD